MFYNQRLHQLQNLCAKLIEYLLKRCGLISFSGLSFFFNNPYLKRTKWNPYRFRFVVRPPVLLSRPYLGNAWRYRVDVKTIYIGL